MKIRKAKPEDAPIITKINVETWQDAYRGIIDDAILDARKIDEKRISTWAKIIEDINHITLVCETEGKIVGYLHASYARDDLGIENEITALYVERAAQRKGVGSALIKEYKRIINNKSFYLYALKKNKKAADFYQKNGGVINEKYNHTLTIQGQTLEEICYVFEGK